MKCSKLFDPNLLLRNEGGFAFEIRLTAAPQTPLPGDWQGITFGTNDQGSSLRGVTIEYGGGTGFGPCKPLW